MIVEQRTADRARATVSRHLALDIFRTACRYDVLACKPGNVCIEHPGHGMSARDFLASAAAAAEPATHAEDGVGECIRKAVAGSVDAAGCNTNLGILLLCVPLLHAALRPLPGSDLRARTSRLLRAAGVDDSAAVFAAIRCANPGGLGDAPAEDVHAAPTLPLREVMALAQRRDLIARQYVDDFSSVFELGIPTLRDALHAGEPLSWAVTCCYLAVLSEHPDSHVARKHGERRAEAVSARARAVASTLKACEDAPARRSVLTEFDAELKHGGVNPGTSADLTVASLVAWLLDTALGQDRPARLSATPPGGRDNNK